MGAYVDQGGWAWSCAKPLLFELSGSPLSFSPKTYSRYLTRARIHARPARARPEGAFERLT